jgi:hypothetical protein
MENTEITATREEIIAALCQFDEGSQGDVFDNITKEKLYERLEATAEELGGDYTADDLIKAVDEGF